MTTLITTCVFAERPTNPAAINRVDGCARALWWVLPSQRDHELNQETGYFGLT